MNRLCDLLFELSNEDRLSILDSLSERPRNLTALSKALGQKIQETSRNTSRLCEAKLIGRDSDGSYSLTPLGEGALRLLDGYRFLSEHSEYFSTHTLRDIPGEFVDRLGALFYAEQPREVISTLSRNEKMVAEAEEYVLTIGDSILTSYISLEIESVLRGVSNRTIFTRGIEWSPEIRAELNREEKVLEAAGMSKFLDFRYVDRVDIYMMMSEKEVAGITFRTVGGVFDHVHFSGSDSRFHGWCKDLFEYYWSRSKLA